MIYTSHRKRILVTGGSGFLGWHLVKHLAKLHDVSLPTPAAGAIPLSRIFS